MSDLKPRTVRSGSDRRAPGSLRDALLAATAGHLRTPQEVARMIGSAPDIVRATARRMNIPLAARPVRIAWSDEMKAVLTKCIIARVPAEHIAERIGVSTAALLTGMAEVIRDGRA